MYRRKFRCCKKYYEKKYERDKEINAEKKIKKEKNSTMRIVKNKFRFCEKY